MKTLLAHLESPLGPLIAEFSADGALRRLDLLADSIDADLARRRDEGATVERDDAIAADLATQLRQYFAGERRSFDVRLELEGTDFQREVWSALLAIPYGEVVTYGALADSLGRSGASRAVGSANGANPVPILVPCHRVVAAGGSLGGYSAGLDRKRLLLELEGALLPLGN